MMKNKSFFTPEPRIFGHRGNPNDFPENTIPSFESAINIGVDVIETDVHCTKDGHFVVLHDDTVERTTNGKGKVRNLTLSELKTFDAGFHFTRDGQTFPYRNQGITIPTLQEVLRAFPNQRFNIDLKDENPAQAESYCNLLKKENAVERVLTASEYWSNLKAVRKLLPEMATSASLWEALGIFFLYRSSLILFKKEIVADALQVPEFYGTTHVVTKNFVKAMHKLGVRVHVWTINREVDMKRILALNVDAIMSDNPALLKNVIAQLNRGS
ncbi:MAG: glycerophosphodiester phosphodiesterase [Spirochaetes bacterium]|nr:glycerophosphodiester phosphodiesterase [Spirochaetota bacterium]